MDIADGTAWIIVLIAPVIGSFLGVLIRRLPRGEPVMMDRSRCESCGHPLSPQDLVPLLSYVRQHGRCRYCAARIDPFHLTIELAALAVALLTVLLADPAAPLLIGTALLGWILLTLSWIDARTFRLPDVLTLPLLLAGLGEALLTGDRLTLLSRVLGAIVGWGALTLLGATYRAVRGRAGLGGGDAKLLAAGGAWTGLDALPTVLLVAALIGLALAAVMALRGKTMTLRTALPFGPCLAGAIWLVRLAGHGLFVTPQL